MNTIKHPFGMPFFLLLMFFFLFLISPLHATQTDTLQPAQLRSFVDMHTGLAHALTKALHDRIPSTFTIRKAQPGFCANNTTHGMNLTFTENGPRLNDPAGAWQWSMHLRTWGTHTSLKATPPATLTATGHSMEYHRGPTLTEWYRNSPLGLEQGFTLCAPPASSKGEHLVLEMALSGNLTPRLQDTTLLLCDATGESILRYTGLYAVDSTGKSLPAHLALQRKTLQTHRIIVDDTAATYPITIDPWVQRHKLVASDGAADGFFGHSVAISGNTMVVGAYEDDDNGSMSDSAYVFGKTQNLSPLFLLLLEDDG